MREERDILITEMSKTRATVDIIDVASLRGCHTGLIFCLVNCGFVSTFCGPVNNKHHSSGLGVSSLDHEKFGSKICFC